MRRSALTVGLVGSLLLSSAEASAQAQAVSDGDREAARNLYKEGYELQAAGSYAEALDRFERSQKVYPAPTALLHIAECEARLLRLVEAAETYRTLARTQLAPNAPPAFVAAQTQGAAELQQIEPRIPHVRIDVTPVNVPNLAVTIDDQPMNVALLGVDRPIDPGEHKIAAVAPSFERTEVVVAVGEKEPTRRVALVLKPLPTLAAPVVVPPAQPVQPRVIYVQAPPPPYPAAPYYAPPPPPAPPPAPPAPQRPPESRKGLFFGPRIGAVYPYVGAGLADTLATGFSLGAELDFRFARRLFLGALVDHGFLGTARGAESSGSTYSTTGFDLVFGVVTNPDRLAALFQFGFGYRVLSGNDGTSLTSPEALLGAGLSIPIGAHVRLVPRIDTTFGSLSGNDASGNSVTAGYAMILFALGGYYSIDFL